MKKGISIILALIMALSFAVPAFASETQLNMSLRSDVPVIYISGDSNELSYNNGTKTFKIGDLLNIFKDSEDGNIKEASFNILFPFLLEGIASNDWDNYYDAVYKEISDVFKPVMLDENGEPNTDCDIPEWEKQDKADAMKTNRVGADGKYGEKDYTFHYDWRLDPIELADDLNDYIEGVKKATGFDKVSITVKCLGCNVVLAYIDKYSTDSLKGVGIDVSTSMGAEFISGSLSGKFGVDGNGISRFASEYINRDGFYPEIAGFAASTLDLLDNTGVLDKLTDVARAQLYSKIEYGIVSAIARSTMFTFPGYWAIVTQEDFDTALTYVFGQPGSETREKYQGLIEKVTNYNENIKKNVFPIMKKVETNGTNVCVISKYGFQMVPFIKESDLVSDEYVSAYRSSFGATTSTVYGTLSDEYIAAQQEKGLGKYISPDKQIDASTCLFPDYTWFIKGMPHGSYKQQEIALLLTVINADKQLTVDDFDLTQFMVYDYNTKLISTMTEENCHNECWTADEKTDHPQTNLERLTAFLKTLFKWLGSLVKLFTYVSDKQA